METRQASLARQTGKWLVLAVCWFIFFLNQADRQVIFSVFPLVKGELGLSDAELGLIGSVFFWVYGLLVPVAGGMADRFSRRWIVIVALAVWSMATIGSSFAAGLMLLVVLRGLTAAGEAFYFPAAGSMISDYHGTDTRATAMAIHQTSNYLGVMVSGGLAGWIGQHYGWRSSFAWFGGAGILVAAVAMWLLREPPRGASEGVVTTEVTPLAERLREAVSSPTLLLHTVGFIGMLLTLTAYLTWMPTLLFRKFGMGLAEAGFHATFWHHLGAMAGTLAGGQLADRFSARTPLSRPITQIVGLLAATPFIYLMGASDSRMTVMIALGLFGLCRGLYDSNLFASPYEVIRPKSRATATGLMLAMAFLFGGVSPLFIGRLAQSMSLPAAVSFTSLFYAAAGLVLAVDALWFFRKGVERRCA
ncbi:MAG: MFS transporter [Bryobacterales bacterium]|nr:MFS transporter [Bryobacterales bacterium]